MSNYEDDQSEDGELARSPVTQEEMDFSLSEDAMDTCDSLDIRPPQAKVIARPKEERARHNKSNRHKEHSRRDKKHIFRERDKMDTRSKKENDLIRHSERDLFHGKEHYRDREYVREKEVYREKDLYREKEHFRDKEIYKEKDVYREIDSYRDKDAYRYKEPYREKDSHSRSKEGQGQGHREKEAARERERERYMEAERTKERKETRAYHTSSDEAQQRGREREDVQPRGRERDKLRPDRERDRERDKEKGAGDKELEDLRSRLLSKRHSKEQQEGSRRKQHDDGPERRNDPHRTAHLQRRDKLLHTEREMSRRKEEGRMALEERRSRRAKRPPSPTPPSPTIHPASPTAASQPQPLPAKRSRPSVSPPEVVTVSDASDHEQPEEGEHSGDSSESSSDSDSDGETASDEEGTEEESSEGEVEVEQREEADIEEVKPEPPHASRSPASNQSESPRRSRSQSRSRSRSRSPSRSRSHSFSPPAEANGGERGEAEASPEHGTPPPRSPQPPQSQLPPYYPALQGCRSVEEFQCLNRIEEGTYGVVYRAKDKTTEEIVALKRLKMEKEKEGFPITSLREINTLLKGQHPNIVTVREIVVGSNMDKIFIVMDYVEHDLKGLMETMRARKQVFLPGEVKCLMQQLLRAVDHLHDNWILHRDLKTSNLLLSHKGILKVGDFGLAREYGSPLKSYTPIVVTLWYRAPELLLAARTYSTPIDMWSVGCIFSELITMHPLFPGKSEVDQLNRIFKDLGTPNETVWPGWGQLPGAKAQWAEQAGIGLRSRVGASLSESGLALLTGLLTYDPAKRLQAAQALLHPYFKEQPLAIDPAMFPTWPAKSEGGRRQHSPKPPSGGDLYKQLLGDDVAGFHMGAPASAPQPYLPPPTSFSLKF